jgi:hypothetical protein
MAYQTLGNRVLGGIGAPGGGMAESFNAGVNTSLGQRAARQSMATAAQELKWKEEDRKIAAQQRAAAAAAQAKAEAFQAKLAAIYASGGAGGATASPAGLKPPMQKTVSRDNQDRIVPSTFSAGVQASMAQQQAAAAAQRAETILPVNVGVSVPMRSTEKPNEIRMDPRKARGIINDIDNRFSATTNPGNMGLPGQPVPQSPVVPVSQARRKELDDQAVKAAAARRLGISPAQAANTPQFVLESTTGKYSSLDGIVLTVLEDGTGQLTSSNGKEYKPLSADLVTDILQNSGPGTQKAPSKPITPITVPLGMTGEMVGLDAKGRLTYNGEVMPPNDPMYPAYYAGLKDMLQLKLSEAENSVFTASDSPLALSNPDLYALNVAKAKTDVRNIQAALATTGRTFEAPASRIDNPAGQLPAETGPKTTAGVKIPPRDTSGLSTITPNAAPVAEELYRGSATPTFGPTLGAPSLGGDLATTQINEFVRQTGFDPNAPKPPDMGQPGQPGAVINTLMQQRSQTAQLAEAYFSAGKFEEGRAIQIELAGIDTKLEAAVTQLALEDARANSTQRLNAIWTDKKGRSFEFVPLGDGNMAVYVDGELAIESASMEDITTETRMMADQAWAEGQAALQQKFNEAAATSGGTKSGEQPFAERTTIFNAETTLAQQRIRDEDALAQAEALARIEVDKDMLIKNNETNQEMIRYALELQNKLPTKAKTYSYQTTDTGGILVLDGFNLVAQFVVDPETGQVVEVKR